MAIHVRIVDASKVKDYIGIIMIIIIIIIILKTLYLPFKLPNSCHWSKKTGQTVKE